MLQADEDNDVCNDVYDYDGLDEYDDEDNDVNDDDDDEENNDEHDDELPRR